MAHNLNPPTHGELMTIINKTKPQENPSAKEFSPSRFKKLEITPKCARKIAYIQHSFEIFCERMLSKCIDNEESRQAVIRLQESCVWFSRSIAMMSAYSNYKKSMSLDSVDKQVISAPSESTPLVKTKITFKKKKIISK